MIARYLPDLHVEAAGVSAAAYRTESLGDASIASVTLARDSLVAVAATGGAGG